MCIRDRMCTEGAQQTAAQAACVEALGEDLARDLPGVVPVAWEFRMGRAFQEVTDPWALPPELPWAALSRGSLQAGSLWREGNAKRGRRRDPASGLVDGKGLLGSEIPCHTQ